MGLAFLLIPVLGLNSIVIALFAPSALVNLPGSVLAALALGANITGSLWVLHHAFCVCARSQGGKESPPTQ